MSWLRTLATTARWEDFNVNYLGIDPGVSGGIAVLTGGTGAAFVTPMLATVADLWQVLDFLDPARTRALVEKLGGMPRDKNGKAMQSGTTMLVMGRNYGHVEMALVGRHIPFREMLPRQWQSIMGVLGDGKESRTEKKNRHKAMAQELFPGVKVTHAIADALLLAECLRRLELGKAN